MSHLSLSLSLFDFSLRYFLTPPATIEYRGIQRCECHDLAEGHPRYPGGCRVWLMLVVITCLEKSLMRFHIANSNETLPSK